MHFSTSLQSGLIGMRPRVKNIYEIRFWMMRATFATLIPNVYTSSCSNRPNRSRIRVKRSWSSKYKVDFRPLPRLMCLPASSFVAECMLRMFSSDGSKNFHRQSHDFRVRPVKNSSLESSRILSKRNDCDFKWRRSNFSRSISSSRDFLFSFSAERSLNSLLD